MTDTPKPPGRPDASTYDPLGTSQLFRQLVYHAMTLAWSFDEQIAGASPELLDKWRFQLWEAEAYFCDIRRKLGMSI